MSEAKTPFEAVSLRASAGDASPRASIVPARGALISHWTAGGRERLYLDEARTLGVPVEIAEAVARLWEATLNDEGADSDFTSAIKPIERAAGVTVGSSEK